MNQGDKRRLIRRWTIGSIRRHPRSKDWSRSAGRWPGGGAAESWLTQQAVPDGCVEIIARTAGRSRWDGEQPPRFAVGLIERPQGFEISGDAGFEGLRLWPWAWSLIGDRPLAGLRGRWLPYGGPALDALEAAAGRRTRISLRSGARSSPPPVWKK